MINDIENFHTKFNLEGPNYPINLPLDVADFRIKFMQEELNEYIKATAEGDMEGQLDALVDLVYVALGTAYLSGFPFQAAWDEVHSCNMMKMRAGPNGEGSKRGSPHDVIKPEGWKGPNYSKILTQ